MAAPEPGDIPRRRFRTTSIFDGEPEDDEMTGAGIIAERVDAAVDAGVSDS